MIPKSPVYKNQFLPKRTLRDFPKPNGNESTCLHIISRECCVTQMFFFSLLIW